MSDVLMARLFRSCLVPSDVSPPPPCSSLPTPPAPTTTTTIGRQITTREMGIAIAITTTWTMAGWSSSGGDDRGPRHPWPASSAMSNRRLPNGTRVGSGMRSRRTRAACFRGREGGSNRNSVAVQRTRQGMKDIGLGDWRGCRCWCRAHALHRWV